MIDNLLRKQKVQPKNNIAELDVYAIALNALMISQFFYMILFSVLKIHSLLMISLFGIIGFGCLRIMLKKSSIIIIAVSIYVLVSFF